MESNNIPKIMAPINSFSGGVQVVDAGADEIYCATQIPDIKDFVLYRGPSSELPSYEELGKVTRYAHENGAKVDLVLNQPYMVPEMEKHVRKHIRNCVDQDVDSLIIGDFGVLYIVKKMDLEIPLIASTYLVSMNTEAVRFLSSLGFNRAVLERHMTLDEISNVVSNVDIGVEILIHGGGCSNINASCYLYHHKFPELINAQQESNTSTPCSLPYDLRNLNDKEVVVKGVPVMDAFEYCSICHLPELISTGVDALKIEGRTGSVWYQAATTRIYRELLDLIKDDRLEEYKARLTELKRGVYFLPVPSDFYQIQDIWCHQNRCYYSPMAQAPYKTKVTWQTWTKQHFSWVQR